MGLSDPANGLLPETLLALYQLQTPIESLRMMNAVVLVKMGIERDQAKMIRRILKGKLTPGVEPASTGATRMMLELERRGVVPKVRTLLRAVTKGLASLQALTDADDIFDLVAEDQLERIRPLLTPRMPPGGSVPENKARGLRADPGAHARQAMKSRRALRVNGNIPPKKSDATGMQRAASHGGTSRPAVDIWANNDRVVVVGDPAGGSAPLDPVAEAARTDA
jgi:hypothetical protein